MLNPIVDAWWMSLAWFVGSVAVGWILEKVVKTRLRAWAARTRWRGDDVVLSALTGMVFFWTLLGGLAFAVEEAPLSDRALTVVRRVLLIAVVWSACTVVSRLIVASIHGQMRKAPQAHGRSSIIANLTAIVIYLLGGMVVLQTLGISITPVLTALGVGGLAVALALQPTLSNLFSGLQLIASRQINNGDLVRLQSGEEGYVVDITWRNTILRALSNHVIVVPNAQLAAATLRNFHLPDHEVAVSVDVSVVLSSDLQQVEDLALETARRVMTELQQGLKDATPTVRFKAFGANGPEFSVGLRASEYAEQFLLKHTFIKALHAAFKEQGIELAGGPTTIAVMPGEGGKQARQGGVLPGLK